MLAIRTIFTEGTLAAGLGLGVVLAAVLRLSRLDLVEFKADEAQALRMTEDMLRLGRFPEIGLMTSQGIAQAPHLMYVLAPVVAISRDPAFVTGTIACANVLTVLGTAWLAWRWFGPLAATSATLLYAVNPWAVFWSRKIWAQELLPPLALLLIVALELAIVQPRRKLAAAATFPLLALATMIHYSMVVLAPLLLVPSVLLARRRHWLALLLGLAAAGLVMLPFLLHEQRIDWVDYPTLRAEMARHPTVFNLDAITFVLGLVTGLGANDLAGVPLERFASGGLRAVTGVLATGLLGLGLGWAVLRLRSGGHLERVRLGLLLTWIALPIVLTLRHAVDLHDHYYLLLYPAPFLLIGAAVGRLGGQARPLVLSALAACLVVAAGQLALITRFVDHLGSGFDSCYDLPLAASQAFDGDLLAFGSRFGSTRGTVELDEADAMPLAYLQRPDFAHLEMQRYGDLGLGRPPAADLAPAVSTARAYANGVRVLGVWSPAASQPDWRPRLAIVWDVNEESPRGSVGWQVRLPEAGLVFAGVAHALPDLVGQRMLSWFTFEVPRDLPPGRHDLVVQLIDGTTNSAVADADGQTAWSQSVSVGYTPHCSA